MAEEEKAIRVIPFTGEWEYWEAKQLARANRRGYKDIMIGKEAVPSDSDPLPSLSADREKHKKLRKLNETGYEDLIMSMSTSTRKGKVGFNIVKKSKTKEQASMETPGACLLQT